MMFIFRKGELRNTQRTPSAFLQRRFDHAWKKYYEYFASLGENVKVLPGGLVVNVINRWLGCSPDAKLMFHNKIGIGESKCPYEHRDSDLMGVARSNKNFYLQVVGGNLHLKHESAYYFQVQYQLALTGAAFYDFVVYTHRSLFIERLALGVNDLLKWHTTCFKFSL